MCNDKNLKKKSSEVIPFWAHRERESARVRVHFHEGTGFVISLEKAVNL